MPQKFANRAKSLLQSTINSSATSLAVASGDADEFPVADTGTDPVNTAGKDWFKLVLIDTSGNYEIMYARTRTLGSGTISNIIRGQDGTTAIGFNAGSFVVQDFVAEDLNTLLATQATQATQIANRVTKAEIQNNTYTAFTTAGTGSAYTLNAVPDAATYQAGQSFDVTFHAASSGTPTIAVDAQGAKNLVYRNAAGTKVTVGALLPENWRSEVFYDGVDFIVQSIPVAPLPSLSPFLRDYLQGGAVTHSGTTLTIQPCQAASGDNSVMMDIATVFTKTFVGGAAAWTAGSGGGGYSGGATVPNNTDLYLYLIYRPDTGTSDWVVDPNSTTPTLTGSLAPYTKFRKLPVVLRFGAGAWLLPVNSLGRVGIVEDIYDIDISGVGSFDVNVPFNQYQNFESQMTFRPSVTAELAWRLLNNATPYTAANDYFSTFVYGDSTGAFGGNAGTTTSGQLLGSSSSVAGETHSVFTRIGPFNTTDRRVNLVSSGYYFDPGVARFATINYNSQYAGGTSGINAARTGLRFFLSTGTFTTGSRFVLKGTRKLL